MPNNVVSKNISIRFRSKGSSSIVKFRANFCNKWRLWSRESLAAGSNVCVCVPLRAARRSLSCGELRRGARAPWRALRGCKAAGGAAPLQLVILDWQQAPRPPPPHPYTMEALLGWALSRRPLYIRAVHTPPPRAPGPRGPNEDCIFGNRIAEDGFCR